MDLVKCFAKRSLAYRKGSTKSKNVEWLIHIYESQILRLLDKLTTRLAFSRGGDLCRSCERPVNGHRST
jgi:hypothetical protein